MEEKNKTFAKNLRYYMDKNDVSQIDLAEKLGVSNATISLYIHGKNVPRMDKLQKLASILGVKVSDLVGDADYSDYTKPKETMDEIRSMYDGTKMLIEYHYIRGTEDSVEKVKKLVDKIMSLSPKDMNFVESMVDRLVGDNG